MAEAARLSTIDTSLDVDVGRHASALRTSGAARTLMFLFDDSIAPKYRASRLGGARLRRLVFSKAPLKNRRHARKRCGVLR
jgi:hypothetical protein